MTNSTIRRVGFVHRRTRFTFLLTSLALLGCGVEEEIRHYKVPKPDLVYAENHVEAEPTGPSFVMPEGWTRQAPVAMSALTLGWSEGDQSAQITVSPLARDGGGLLQNVNRWYRQIGVPEISADDLPERTEEMSVNGIEGTYLEAFPDDESGRAVIGWIGLKTTESWFVKLAGDAAAVKAQREAFRGFLESLSF